MIILGSLGFVICYTICLTTQSLKGRQMTAVTSREVIHNFSAVAARVAAGEELTVTRYGKPVLRLVQVVKPDITGEQRAALVRKALSFQMTAPLGKKFARSDAYDT
jgi:antitoxin (DNA-binding transcriptional repressor) of toxin-antitoxin stability system